MPDNAKRAVIHWRNDGSFAVYADDGVEVISVSDFAPDDRLYRMSPDPIPDDLLDGPVGHIGDGSAAEVKAIRVIKELHGESHLQEVTDE